MKAFSITNPFETRFIELPDVVPSNQDAILKLVRNGICGSDLNSYRGTNAYLTYPRIPGHEIAAEIISIPKNDRGLLPGMLVTCNPYFNCGHCYSCRRGFSNCCQSNQTMGVQRDGGMMDYIAMPVERIVNSNGLPPDLTALVEPFSIAFHGVQKANIQKGENVLVIGTGTIGVFAALSAKESGANVFVADIAKEKLDFAINHFDIDGIIINDSDAHFTEQVMQSTAGNGFDTVIEAVGSPATFRLSIDASAFCGRVIQIGISDKTLDFNFTLIQKKELKIFGSRNATKKDFGQVVSLFLRKRNWKLDNIISSRFPFSESSEAFRFLSEQASSLFKVMLIH